MQPIGLILLSLLIQWVHTNCACTFRSEWLWKYFASLYQNPDSPRGLGMSQYFLRMPWYLARTKLPMQKPLGNFFHSPLLHGTVITWLRCTKWAWQVHDDASWHSSLLPTHLLKWIPSPNDKEERFDTYGTYHPCQSWRFKEHHPNDLISLWWLIHLIFLSRKWNIKMISFSEWCNHAVNK